MTQAAASYKPNPLDDTPPKKRPPGWQGPWPPGDPWSTIVAVNPELRHRDLANLMAAVAYDPEARVALVRDAGFVKQAGFNVDPRAVAALQRVGGAMMPTDEGWPPRPVWWPPHLPWPPYGPVAAGDLRTNPALERRVRGIGTALVGLATSPKARAELLDTGKLSGLESFDLDAAALKGLAEVVRVGFAP